MSSAESQPLILDAPSIPADAILEENSPEARHAANFNTDGKRGSLFGGAATDAALASSSTVLSNPRGNKNATTGLQQFFSPPEAASLIAAVTGDRPVLDFTAGSGALLAGYSGECRYGVELDADHINSSHSWSYSAIHGDAQQAVPMLRAAGARFPVLAINPPFGLDWRDSVHGSAKGSASSGHLNSTVAAYLWALDLMDRFGQGAMVCGTNRLASAVLQREEASGIYAIVDVEDALFEEVELPASIVFFVQPSNRSGGRARRFSATRAELPELAPGVIDARDRGTRHISEFGADSAAVAEKFRAVEREHSRRARAAEEKRAAHRYDLMLKGSKVSVGLSAYSKLALANERGSQAVRAVELLSGQHTAYFGQNPREIRQLRALRDDGLISVEPALEEAAEKALAEAEKSSTPLFNLKPQMRLGWLTDLDRITCIKDDPERGFASGEDYRLATHSKVETTEEKRVVETKSGEPELRQFKTERRLLQVTIGEGESRHVFDEGPENIAYLIEHFEIPDPGSVAEKFPGEVARYRRLLEEIQADYGFTLKEFQIDHLSRLLTKRRGLLAHEQGLGKTVQQMVLAEATVRLGAKDQVLFVSPQDLLPQWSREIRRFFGTRIHTREEVQENLIRRYKEDAGAYFGRELEEIRTPAKAREVARRLKAGEEGWFITYYEALSIVGREHEVLPERPVDPRVALGQRLAEYKREKIRRGEPVRGASPQQTDQLDASTTRDACPACGADTSVDPYAQAAGSGPAKADWNGEVCNRASCGYVHRRRYRKSAYSHLTTAFKRGVKCVDEVSEVRGDDSLRSKALRGMARGPHFYGATGTPLSNYLPDAFWGLWLTLGNASAAFPYDYHGGKAKFESDFAVIEHMMGREKDGESNQKKRRKLLPRVANVSQFWRLAQPSISRCRKEQTGEPLVERTYYPVRVPMGVSQKRANDFWLSKANFASYFAHKFPTHSMVENGLVEKWAAALGQLWRLETAATLPASDGPSKEWPTARGMLGELSNYTPATLKVLEHALEHVEAGEKVLIGSDLILTGKWFAERLREKGVRAVHITEEDARGIVGTKSPGKRAEEIRQFVEGEAQVLCAGVAAVKLGHNLDCSSTVIVHGLPYSFSVFDQFIARVHRLTSRKPVSVYSVIPKGSLAEQKYELLMNKGGSSDLAFDGELQVQPEEATDWSKVIEQMRERGIRSADEDGEYDPEADTVLEAEVRAAWLALPPLAPPPSSAAAPELARERQPALAGFREDHDIASPHTYEQQALF